MMYNICDIKSLLVVLLNCMYCRNLFLSLSVSVFVCARDHLCVCVCVGGGGACVRARAIICVCVCVFSVHVYVACMCFLLTKDAFSFRWGQSSVTKRHYQTDNIRFLTLLEVFTQLYQGNALEWPWHL